MYTLGMTKQQRLVLFVSILASFVAFLDGSVTNVALPAITRELGGGLAVQQWVVDAYLITLGAFILVAGSFSDLLGRKKVLLIGLIGFGVTSLLCAAAPSSLILIIARALQGIAGALLVPSSLALIIAGFSGKGESKAIGSWTAWTSVAFVVGPLLGGFLVDYSSWRLVFAINILPIVFAMWLLSIVKVPETRHKDTPIDRLGVILCAVGLGGPVYALIEQPHYGWASPHVFLPLLVGLLAFGWFLRHEARTEFPMLPLNLFASRNFSAGNVATLAIYAGLSVATFLIAIFIQQVGGYKAFQAGLALLPITIIMFLLSPRFGALSGRFGPRLFMTVGPIVASLGFLLLLRVDQSVDYVSQLLPGIIVFGCGLAMTVSPLTSAVLGSVESKHAGIGSAINNAVARIAGLIATAAIGTLIGSNLNVAGFHRGLLATAGLLALGGIVSAIGIRNPGELIQSKLSDSRS
jgi:EmrB/QacA subfamily drug resistance transporter